MPASHARERPAPDLASRELRQSASGRRGVLLIVHGSSDARDSAGRHLSAPNVPRYGL
jgi:hypothetical protein